MRSVLVTGASRGIGRAIATAFAANGDRVAIHHRNSSALAAQLRDGLPGKGHVVVQADMTDAAAVQAMVSTAAAELGGLDVLVNNAGGGFGAHPLMEVSYETWQRQWRHTIDTNLIGAANATWCAVRHMTSGGRIVNVSSRGAFRGEPDVPAYGASKAGLNSLGQSMAVALAPRGIAVTGVAPGFVSTDKAAGPLATCVAPGFVETDLTNDHLKPPRGEEIRAQSPFNRVARPEEIAAAVLWLASPEAEWASGAILDLNGASYLRT